MTETHGATFPPDEPAGTPLPEGEERPPAGTWAASAVRWSLVGLMAIAAASAWGYLAATGGVVDVAGAHFRCPMHPGVVTEQKGECPICGMDLVPVSREAAPAKGDSARGVARAEGAGGAAGRRSDLTYTCPLHPAFVVDDPRARCPECGMKVVPKSADIAPAPAQAAGGPVGALAGKAQSLAGMLGKIPPQAAAVLVAVVAVTAVVTAGAAALYTMAEAAIHVVAQRQQLLATFSALGGGAQGGARPRMDQV